MQFATPSVVSFKNTETKDWVGLGTELNLDGGPSSPGQAWDTVALVHCGWVALKCVHHEKEILTHSNNAVPMQLDC